MRRHRIMRLLYVWPAMFCLAQNAYALPFPWPDARAHPRVILTADQDIMNYMEDHPRWFSGDFLVAGMYIKDVPYGESDAAMRKLDTVYHELKRRNIFMGTYISATTILPELSLKVYPANAVSLEDMPRHARYLGPWIREPSHTVVDLSDVATRSALQKAIRQLWLHVPTVMRFVDNAAVHPRVARMQPWNVYCDHMKTLREVAETARVNAIFNVFVRSWEMSDQDMRQLIDAVAGNGSNGVSFPLPWSQAIKDDKNAIGWAIYRYRQLLDNRIAVILVPSDEAPELELYKWILTWRKPGDRLYIAWPYWKISPGP